MEKVSQPLNAMKKPTLQVASQSYPPTETPFPNMCRVCLSENITLVPIKEIYFTHDLTEKRCTTIIDLISVFKQFCDVDVSSLDQKPQKICENCIELAGKAFNFFQLFLYSNKELERKLEAKNAVLYDLVIQSDYVFHHKSNENNEQIIVTNKDGAVVKVFQYEKTGNDDVIENQDVEEIKVESEKITVECDYQIDINKKSPDCPQKRVRVRASEKTDRKNDIFRCNLCQRKAFHGLKQILEHVEEEHDLIKQCVLCQSTLMMSSSRKYHYATHSLKSIVCKSCRLVFETEELLEEHKQSLEHNNRNACPVCKKIFSSRIRMRCHFNSVHRKRNLQCSYCGANFSFMNSLRRHEKRHQGKGSFLCAHCGQVFTTNFSLKIHVQKLHKIDQGMDRYMNYNPKRKVNLPNIPAERKSRLPKYQCQVCDFKYISYTHYLKHCSFHPEFKDFSCVKCKLSLTSLKNYMEHMKCHYRFSCSDCGKKFTTASGRWQHKQVHKIGKYACEICNYTCTLKTRFDHHMLIHGGERPYVCETCGNSFKQMSTMRTHIRTVHQTKPLSCEFCGMKFLFNGVLRIHLRTHTGVKPFGCPYCNKKFIDTTGRNRHVRSYHPGKTEDFQIYKQTHQEEEIRMAEL